MQLVRPEKLSRSHRLKFGTATGVAGLMVAATIVLFDTTAARYLPPAWVFLGSAFVGAGAIGLLCANGFGRNGGLGALVAVLTSVVMTFAGAELGANIALLMGWMQFGLADWFFGLGLLTIAMSAAHFSVVLVWAGAMTGLHLWTKRLRKQ